MVKPIKNERFLFLITGEPPPGRSKKAGPS
jgi:hypothetical protein